MKHRRASLAPLVSFALLAALARCGVSGGSDPDGEARPEGSLADGQTTPDAALPDAPSETPDAGAPAPDALAEADAAAALDAFPALDAPVAIDASPPPDAPAPLDALARTDAPAPSLDAARLDARAPDDARLDAAPLDAPPRTDASADGPTTPEGGLGTAGPSPGCGRAPGIALNAWVSRTITVGGAAREYFVRLPTGYDPARRYPIVYQFHGCSDAAARQDNNVPVQNQSGTNAIHVRGRAASRCWSTSATGPDLPYIDAMFAAVEGAFCVDTGRRFAAGYSSGAFMTHVLGCVRGAQLRGIASIAGGQTGSRCTGTPAALLIHDRNDGTVGIAASEGARDQLAQRNGCNATAPRTPTARPPCEAYAGCTAGQPVHWCETSGRNHDRQDALAAPAFWEFFNALPAR